MKKKMFFLIDCTKAANYCDKEQYNETGFRERTTMYLHLLFCRACRAYLSQNSLLTKLIEKAKIRRCTPEEKKKIRERFKKAIAEQKP